MGRRRQWGSGVAFSWLSELEGDREHHFPDDSLQVLTEGRTMYPALWSLHASQSWF